MKATIFFVLFALLPTLATHGDESVASILPHRRVEVAVPVTAACPGGALCPTVAPAVDPSAPILPAMKVIPPAPPAAIPGLTPTKAPALPKPFPGPSLTPPRVLWVWDNGVIWESGANVWRWQNDDGTWQQK
jgi:hypothetical protein